MKKIAYLCFGFIGAISLFWLMANPGVFAVNEFIALRNFMVQYFGVLSMCIMSLIMVLATRPVWLENITGGLDKTYRLHKWFGIAALVTSIIHWLWSVGPKWASKLGLFEVRRRRGQAAGQEELSALQDLLLSQRKLAEQIGEWAFYVAVALILIALIKWFPYRLFVKTHTLFSAVFLALVAHSLVLFDFGSWVSPIGIVTAVLMTGGSIAAVLALTGRIGRSRQTLGRIVDLERHDDIRAIEVGIMPAGGWPGHKAGQFAFADFGQGEPAHPFTISSGWNPKSPRITLLIKALGDYTNNVPSSLQLDDDVRLEGPYGRFTFDAANDRQVWISGGIGVTPFLAKLEELAGKPVSEGRKIDFYQAATQDAEGLMQRIEDLAKKAGVRLHVWRDGRDGFLTGSRIRKDVPGWRAASFWFCGPAGFAAAIERDLVAHGLPEAAFHRELFEFR